jgi:hypothetical protein
MVILRGMMTISGGIYWNVLDSSGPGVLTLITARAASGYRTAPIPGVLYPEEEHQAWTFDLGAMKERAEPEVADCFPSWAVGKVTMEPSVEGGILRFDFTPEMLE